jgi:hypothetical protein
VNARLCPNFCRPELNAGSSLRAITQPKETARGRASWRPSPWVQRPPWMPANRPSLHLRLDVAKPLLYPVSYGGSASLRRQSPLKSSPELPGPSSLSLVPRATARCGSRNSKLVERRSVIALDCAVAPNPFDVVPDFAPSNHAEKGTIERPVACCAPFFFARHRSRRLALTGYRAPRTLVQPPSGRDTERAILVDPGFLFEANAIGVSNVAASRLVARVRRCRTLQQPVDASFDPVHRRRRARCGRLRIVAPLAAD